MKSLKKFISELQEPFAKGSSLFNELVPKANYSSLWCCESPSEANYEEFLKHNSLDCTKESYKLYQYMSFVESIKRMSTKFGEAICEDGYEVFQKTHSVNENLLHSYDAHKLIEKISKIIDINDVRYLHKNHKTTHTEFLITDENKLDDDRIISLFHQYNYYIRHITKTDNGVLVSIEPYKPEDLTNKIYDDFEGIIYHCTLKSKVNKILNGEIKPKGKSGINEYRPKFFYYIVAKPKDAIHGLRQIMNLNIMLSKGSSHQLTKDDFTFLRIDLNKFNRKIKFRLDSSGTYDKVITEEPVPGYCCEEIKLEDIR